MLYTVFRANVLESEACLENSSINVKGKSKPVLIQFLHYPDHCIQCHRHDTQQHDRHEQPVHLKEVKGQKDKMTIVFFMADSANKFNFRDSEIALRKIWRL